MASLGARYAYSSWQKKERKAVLQAGFQERARFKIKLSGLVLFDMDATRRR
ncbi:MAG TPA: hypothetical protein VGO47_09595 [Chlamydiales bacterium]|nr:hypothetical protein [Chlamydiales bacterium]